RLQRLVHPSVELDLIVQRTKDVRDGALLGNWGNAQFEVRDVRAFQTIEHGTYVDELVDLLPPFGPPHQPTKERRVDFGAVGAKQHEILTERKFQLRRSNSSLPGVASARENHVIRGRFCLPSPLQEISMRDS